MADHFELLRQAIDRNTAIALALPSAGALRTYRSRLVEMDEDAILLESVSGEADALDALIASGEGVKVSFRADTQNVEFTVAVRERRRGHRLNASTEIEVLRVDRPADIRVVQRRTDYRVTLTPDSEVTIQCWRISEQYDLATGEKPPAAAMLHLGARDLSAGGIGGIWKRRKDEPTTLVANQRLRIDITGPAGPAVSLDGRVRFTEALPDPDLSRMGVQFIFSPSSLADRQKVSLLNKLIGELQRAELRRLKIAR